MAVQLPAPLPPLGLNWSTFGAQSASVALAGIESSPTGPGTVLRASFKVTSTGGAFTLTGVNNTLTYFELTRSMDAPAPLPSLSSLLRSGGGVFGFQGSKGTFVETGRDVLLSRNYSVVASGTSLLATGAPGESDFEIEMFKGTFTLTGNPANVGRVFVLSGASFSIPINNFTGFFRTAGTTKIFGATENTLGLVGSEGTLAKSARMTASGVEYVWQGIANTWTSAKGNATGSFVLTGKDALFVKAANQQRRVRIKFVTSQGAPVAGPISVDYAFFDQSRPKDLNRPVQQGIVNIDSSGYIDITIDGTTLSASQIGYLVITNNTGNPDTSWKEFSGPVRVI